MLRSRLLKFITIRINSNKLIKDSSCEMCGSGYCKYEKNSHRYDSTIEYDRSDVNVKKCQKIRHNEAFDFLYQSVFPKQ